MAKVSVIVPVYNVEEYLDKCLSSIVNQTIKDIEIIIVSRGPKACDDICQEYADKDERIVYIQSQAKGLSRARNLGIKAASGDYISFIDSDDWINPEFIEKLYEKAKEYDADLVFANSIYYDNEKFLTENYMSKQAFKLNKDLVKDFEDKKVLMGSVVAWNKLYKKKLLEENNILFPVDTTEEDIYGTIASVICAEKIAFSKESVYYYRIREDSLRTSQNLIAKKLNDIIYVHGNVVDFIKNGNFTNDEKQKYLDFIQSYYINQLYVWRDRMPSEVKADYIKRAKEFLITENVNMGLLDKKTKRRYEILMEQDFITKIKKLFRI